MKLFDFSARPETGSYAEYRLSYRRLVVKGIVLFGLPILALYAAAQLFYETRFLGGYLVFAMIVTLLSLVFIYFRPTHADRESLSYDIFLRVFLTLLGTYLLYAIWAEGELNRIPWYFIFPVLVFYSVELKEGLVWILAFTVLSAFALLTKDYQMSSEAIYGLKLRVISMIAIQGFISMISSYVIRSTLKTLFGSQAILRASENRYRQAYENVQAEMGERKRVEQELQSSLKEKGLLLKEIHHRVKNNLQVVSSLLNLQLQFSKDQETADVFRNGLDRIQSMALVHEKLYQSRELSRVDFKNYTNDIVSELMRSYGIDSNLIKIASTVEDIFLDLDQSVPCGLIINELVSNSLKHAFADNRSGEIQIDFHLGSDGRYQLMVSDNGVGMPEKFDLNSNKTLGLQLVKTLVEQLEGTIELHIQNGTSIRISFPSKLTEEMNHVNGKHPGR
jgi:two-component sensor histidine kinase